MSPLKEENKNYLNKHIKLREMFRPYAPCVMFEYQDTYFDLQIQSPFMLIVANVKHPDSIPAVTHTDGTARVQTVDQSTNQFLHGILSAFKDLTGVPVLLNTSFNISEQPIVETPKDAIETFRSTKIDFLCLENFLLEKPLSYCN